MKTNLEEETKKYKNLLCSNCSKKDECTQDKIFITQFSNSNRTVRCINYRYKNASIYDL